MCTPEQFEVLTTRLSVVEETQAYLKREVAQLRAWTEGWPGEREGRAISDLIRVQLDLYRTSAELALTALSERIHADLDVLKGGMTLGAADAIADLATKIQLDLDMHKRTQTNQQTLLEHIQAVATTQEHAATFDAGVERLITTYQSLWEAQKAEAEAARAAEQAIRVKRAQDEQAEKARRLAREQRRAAQSARLYRLAQSLAVPMLMSAIGTPLALLTSISGTLPQHAVVSLSVLIFTLGCSFALYWGVLRKPPVIVDTEERLADIPLPPVPPVPQSVQATTTTTTTSTSTTSPQPPDNTQAAGG